MSPERTWPVIAALGVQQIIAWGSSYYLVAVLATPIATATSWPLPWIFACLSAGLLVAGLVSPRAGNLIGKRGGRPILACSSLLLGLGLLLLAAAPSFWVFMLGWLVMGIGMGTGLTDAAFSTLGQIYGSSARPAISTLTLLGGLSSTICWPLSAFLVGSVGWRGTCLIFAAMHLAITLPLVLVMIPKAPALPVIDQTQSAQDESLTPTERQAFLLLAAILTLGGVMVSIVSVHLMTLLQDRGLTLAEAVSIGALIGPSQICARFVEMANKGRHHPIWTLTVAMSLIASGLVLLWAEFSVVAVVVILYGCGNGIYSIARGTLPLAIYSPRRYTNVVGRLAMPNLIAQALAPTMAGLIIAKAGSGILITILALIGTANVALVAALRLTWARSR